MNIAIIGAGAMGSLFGALLAESGNTAILLGRQKDHADAVNASGLVIEYATPENEVLRRVVHVKATVHPDAIGPVDLALVCVKSTQTRSVAKTVARIIGDTGQVLTLQNGMGNAEALATAVEPSRILAGTTAHGATFLGPGLIRHAGRGQTLIGAWSPQPSAPPESVIACFNAAGIAAQRVESVQAVLWEKLFVNIGINAITALTGITNGQLLDRPETRRIARDAVEEAMAVARRCGISIDGDPVKKMFEIAAATSANRSSMGQDVDHRRITEISAINGFVVHQADKAGIAVPVNRTLSALVETLQAHF